MKTHSKRLLSILLSVAMILSLFVVPAAADANTPGTVGYTWSFGADNTDFHTGDTSTGGGAENGTYGHATISGSVTFDTLTLTTGTGGWNKTWCAITSGTMTVPVTEACNMKIYTQYGGGGKATVGDKETPLPITSDGVENYVELHLAEACSVVISGSTYLTKIVLDTYTAPSTESEVVLAATEATAEVGGAAAVKASMKDATASDWTVTSADTGVATAEAKKQNDGSAIVVITGVAVGTTTVTVQGTVDSKNYEKEISVTVTAATALGAGTYKIPKTNEVQYAKGGLTWEAGKWGLIGSGDHGPKPSAGAKVTMWLAKPEAGKKVDVTFETCAASFGGGEPQVTCAAGTVGEVVAIKAGEKSLIRGDSNKSGENAAYEVKVSGIEVSDAAGDKVEFTFGSATYVHGFIVEHVAADADPSTEPSTTPSAEPSASANPQPTNKPSATNPPAAGGTVAAGTIDFQQMGADSKTEVPATAGVTIEGTYSIQQGKGQHGMNATSDTLSVKLKLEKKAVVTVQGCRFGKLSAETTTATAAGTAVAFPEVWDQGGDPEYMFAEAPAGEFVLTVPKGAWIHNIKVDYATSHDPQMQLDATNVKLKMDTTPTATVKAMTRFTTAAVTAESKDTSVVTAAVSGKTITLTAKKAGDATVEVALTGTTLKETITVKVLPAGLITVEPGIHQLSAKGHDGANGTQITSAAGLPTGIELDSSFDYSNDHGPKSNKGVMTVALPEGKYSTLKLTTCEYGNGGEVSVSSGVIDVAEEGTSEGTKAKVYAIYNATGTTEITFGGAVYIHGITVGEFTDTTVAVPPSLTVDKTTVTVTVGGAAETVAVTAKNTTAAVKAESKDTKVATATVSADGKSVTIAAVAPGSTTVDIYLDGVEATEKTKQTVNVEVEAAGTVHYIKGGTYAFGGNDDLKDPKYRGMTVEGLDGKANSHGLQGKGKASITLNLERKANVTFTTCRYGAGTKLKLETTSGTLSKTTEVDESGAPGLQFVVTGAEGTATFTFIAPSMGTDEGMGDKDYSGIWIPNMNIEYAAAERTNPQIEVWDLGAVVTEGKGYVNHITPEAWVASGALKTGVMSGKTGITFADLTINNNANDRIYSDVAHAAFSEALGGEGGNGKDTYAYEYPDGYRAAGGMYGNGKGRSLTIANTFPGDKFILYAGSCQNGEVPFVLSGIGGAAEQEPITITQAVKVYDKMVFVADYEGTYNITANGPGKPMFHRVVRVPGVKVEGELKLPEGFTATEYKLKFINAETKRATFATVADGKYSVMLAAGETYNAMLTGVPGWGITKATKVLTLGETDGVGTTEAKVNNLEVEVKPTYTFSGKLTGFAADYDISKLAIVAIPEEGSGSDEMDVTIDKTAKTFSVQLDPEVTYTLQVTGVNDYSIKTPATVVSEKNNLTQDIVMELKALHTASGKFLGLGEGVKVTALTFENVEDGYTYEATLTADGYTVKLRDGGYAAKATVEGYGTKSHVVVDGKDAVKDLLFAATNAQKPVVEWAKDVYVGYPDKTPNYKSVKEAVEAIDCMGVKSEDQRVTVHIAPGTYRDQVIVKAPYITLINDEPEKGDVLMTWYYGIGYKYYSAGSPSEGGYYDAERAYDKFEKNIADRWGTAVRVMNTAKGFRAENIVFENSFNRYITEEEIIDGVESTAETISLERNYGTKVQTKAATERAAAMCVEADQSEFYNCQFLSSQDTLYVNEDANLHAYFKNCKVEGQTDYIFGAGNVVFDGCELSWKGYEGSSTAGHITALRTGDKGGKDYLFRNCIVTGNPKLTVAPGNLGRNWGPMATATFLNLKVQDGSMLTAEGYIQMSGPLSETNFREYNTVALDGSVVDTSKRAAGKILTAAEASTIKPTDYFGGWVPPHYVEEDATVAFATAPTITDNGDINTPYPGHTLMVNYSLGAANDANDASIIKWYRVAADGTETLVKATTAVVSRTYQITKADIGSTIKVEVTPNTFSGNTAEAKSITMDNTVRDGFEDPDGKLDPDLGDGVNIFLAGDSTVTDYEGRDEGSWGMFLQNFLDKDLVTVVNHAVGGRSARSFINEGRLDAIAKNIGEGDYLFIQFGHNDCANEKAYRVERYAPLGEPDASGKYPSTAGTKSAVPEDAPQGVKQAGATEWYTWNCGGTYKWYLQQYIDVAKKAGATPILVTPVSRLYYDADGNIRPHHDASLVPGTEETTETANPDKKNTYCEAVKQLAEENGILCIDAFEITKQMYEDAYKACEDTDKANYGRQVMFASDSTHSNKLGGMIQAAMIAGVIQDMDVSIAKTVKAPTMAIGQTTGGQTVFTVDSKGVFTAYDMLTKPEPYAAEATYWMGIGQKLFDALGGIIQPADKNDLAAAIADAEKADAGIAVKANGTMASSVTNGTKFVTRNDKDALDAAIAAAKAVAADENASAEQIGKAVADLKAAVKAFNDAIQTGTKTSSGGGYNPGTSSTGTGTGKPAADNYTKTDANGNTAKKTTNVKGDVEIVVTDKNGEVLAEINLPASIAAPKTKFKDVPDNHWAAKAINDMASLGMVKGVSEDTYDMNSPMTRGAIATVLFRLANGKAGKTTSFADVAADAWYTDAVGWAVASGVVNGYSETAFGPDDTITRQQLAVMITRLLKLAGVDTTAKTDKLDAFVDGAATNDWAKDSVAWCVENGIMKGKGNDILDPTAAVSRAEAATMLDRAIEALR